MNLIYCKIKLTNELLLHLMMVGKSKHVHIDIYVKIYVCMSYRHQFYTNSETVT